MRGKKLFLVAALGLFGIPTIAHADAIHRLYNPNTGDHLMTVDQNEYQLLNKLGWKYEGIIGDSAKSGTAVYRLYNPHSGEHFFTQTAVEQQQLTRIGWKMEGVAFYFQDKGGQAVYRLYNPNTKKADGHFFTSSVSEKNYLVSIGWKDEGVAFYQAPAKTQETQPTEPAKEEPTPSKGEDTTVPKDNGGTVTSPTSPSTGDSGSSTPTSPSAGDNGGSTPTSPSAGDNGGSTPTSPSAGDNGSSTPTTPSANTVPVVYLDPFTNEEIDIKKDENGVDLPSSVSADTNFSNWNITIKGYKYSFYYIENPTTDKKIVKLYYRKIIPIKVHLVDFETGQELKTVDTQIGRGDSLNYLSQDEKSNIFGEYHVVLDNISNRDFYRMINDSSVEYKVYVKLDEQKGKFVIHYMDAQDNNKEVRTIDELTGYIDDLIPAYNFCPRGYSLVNDIYSTSQIQREGITDYYFSVVPTIQKIKIKYYAVTTPDQDITGMQPTLERTVDFDMSDNYYLAYMNYLTDEDRKIYGNYTAVGNGSEPFDWHKNEYSTKMIRVPKITFKFLDTEGTELKDPVVLSWLYQGGYGYYDLSEYVPKGYTFLNPEDIHYHITSNEDVVKDIYCKPIIGGTIRQKLIDLDMNSISTFGEDITYKAGETIPQVSDTADTFVVTDQSPIYAPANNTVFLVKKDQLLRHVQSIDFNAIFDEITERLNINLQYDATKYTDNKHNIGFPSLQKVDSNYYINGNDVANNFMEGFYLTVYSRVYSYFYSNIKPQLTTDSKVSYFYNIRLDKAWGVCFEIYYRID